MVDAPETIGLVASPFGLRLWNREEDDSEAGVIRYLRADIAERQLAEARADAASKSGSWVLKRCVVAEAERDRLAAEVARLRSALTETADALESRLTDDEKTANIRKPYEHPLSAYDRARATLRALQAQEGRDG